MEPILELATRITSQIWFLHDLFPDAKCLADIARENWRGAAEPHHDFAKLKNLLDLVGLQGDWTASEWFWNLDPPQRRPGPKPPLHHLLARSSWVADRYRERESQKGRIEAQTNWNELSV